MKIQFREVGERILHARAGGRVQRLHAVRHGGYSVAEHSWGVALLCAQLFPEAFPRIGLIALSHDLPEAWLGDLPRPTRWMLEREVDGEGTVGRLIEFVENRISIILGLPNENVLSGQDAAIFAACDALEYYLWLREELARGNQFIGPLLREFEQFIDWRAWPEPAREAFLWLRADSCVPQTGLAEMVDAASKDFNE